MGAATPWGPLPDAAFVAVLSVLQSRAMDAPPYLAQQTAAPVQTSAPAAPLGAALAPGTPCMQPASVYPLSGLLPQPAVTAAPALPMMAVTAPVVIGRPTTAVFPGAPTPASIQQATINSQQQQLHQLQAAISRQQQQQQQPAAAAAAAPDPTATARSGASAARQDTQLGDPQQPEQHQMAQQPQHAHSCDGAELLDFINSSEWATVWEAKLQRSMFRDQETLVLTRREPVSPTPPPTLAATPATL